MMQRIFITTLSSPESVSELNLSFAACNFSRNLMSGGMFDKTYSILPPFVRGSLNQKVMPKDAEIIYSKYRERKRTMYKILALWDENIQIYKQIPAKASVWYYNLCILNVLLFLCIKLFKPDVKQNVIVLDYTPSRRIFSLFKLYKWLFNHADSTILLARYSGFTNKNSAYLPGVVPLKVDDYPEILKISNEFLISGSLAENISLLRTLLIPAFKKMPNLILHITGTLSDEIDVLNSINSHKNIIYHGKLEFREYLELLDSITFVFSTRDPTSVDNQCNFPSKIIESLLHNRAVVSTIKYPQLENIKYFVVPSTLSEFICSIDSILLNDESTIMQYVNQGDEIERKFSVQMWRNVMIELEKNEK